VVQKYAEDTESEVAPAKIVELFRQQYLAEPRPLALSGYQLSRENNEDELVVTVSDGGKPLQLRGRASGVVGAFVNAVESHTGDGIVLVEYSEHTLSQADGAGADAVTYVQLNIDGRRYCGVGISSDIVEASLRAILGAVNQSLTSKAAKAA
jgi:2-isopropylmalate synthase